MFVPPTTTLILLFIHYTQCRDPCLWHLLLPVILLIIHYTQFVIHVCATYYHLSSFCLSTILSFVIHVCGNYYYCHPFVYLLYSVS